MSRKTILLNGKPLKTDCKFLSEAIKEFIPSDRPYAIELNGIIIPRSDHLKTIITENDKIEIISAVGGG
ncbi:MAG: sulfur carrier protein ThiS [Gammaproteobacteria bacterium]|jgi:sulfur carrier protein|uniref:Sulfur carrier protein ThiS n=1 Tax=SAR86 cluster bacterium TaxID=2030880 RepID=A0A520MXH2_9GAMM|nr:thiamine biosynthesis protein ThiS [Gammaproteobacteria bacterium]MBA4730043.1 sulfur carrier protein ThiS [SAR86 cluster bacterium]RZO25922.1 MAG: sulfur carrier protein ThiS [SAR86 cluster bacterium]|tara:strand:+ start:268 stop:474 length:207 start_codon:yes stop_codon:yes gene_type:complete